MARVPGDHACTCRELPRSSLTTMPVKRRSPRIIPLITVGEKTAGRAGSILL